MVNFEQTITQIRNILRSAGITGMESINHCITFIIIKYMTTPICEILDIPIEYSYQNLKLMIESDNISNDDVYKHIYSKNTTCIMHFIHGTFKFTNIKFKLESIDNLIKIIKLVDTLDLEKLEIDKDIIGTIYELHLKTGSAGGGMRDLGQYFTHRAVIKYMIDLCNPKMIGDKIEKIIDPTCGTGGFLTMTIKYLNEKYPNIDWQKNRDKIIGFDLDVNVVNITKINLLIESKTFMDNIICRDTLYKDMKISDEQCELMADILLCNEPMGITNLQHANCCDRIKDLKIRGTKAEPLFLQLFMEALNDNGRCAVVVPDGVLSNESNLHQGTRKKLIEEFNLVKVITLNDKEFFLNTGVQTSILYFENNGKTDKTIFSSISLDNDKLVEEIIMEVDSDTLIKNNYSLFINKYKVSLENRIDGIEYKKLGDICEFLPKSKRPASFGKDIGDSDFFTSSMKIKRCDIADYNQKSLIIGTGGNANIKIGKNFSCSSDNFILTIDNEITIKYIYYYLGCNIHLLQNGFSGSTIKHLSKDFVKELEIPIPSLEVQNDIVEQLDIINENNTTCQKQIDEFKKIMKCYVKTHTLFGEEKQLGDICEIKGGKRLPKDEDFVKESNYNYLSIKHFRKCKIIGNEFISKKCFEKLSNYKINTNDVYLSIVGTIGLSGIINEKYNNSILTENAVKLTNFDNIISKYIMYYLSMNKDKITSLSIGSIQKKLPLYIVKKIIIKVVSPDEQQTIIDYCDNLQMMIDKLEENIENNNILMKTILENKLKQQTNTTDIVENIVSDNETTTQDTKQDTNDASLEEEKLTKLSVPDLKKICKNKGLKKYSILKKSELIELLQKK